MNPQVCEALVAGGDKCAALASVLYKSAGLAGPEGFQAQSVARIGQVLRVKQ